MNDTEPEDANTVSKLMAKQLHFQQELLNKSIEMRRNLTGDEFERFSVEIRMKEQMIREEGETG